MCRTDATAAEPDRQARTRFGKAMRDSAGLLTCNLNNYLATLLRHLKIINDLTIDYRKDWSSVGILDICWCFWDQEYLHSDFISRNLHSSDVIQIKIE